MRLSESKQVTVVSGAAVIDNLTRATFVYREKVAQISKIYEVICDDN